ncbi:hypothetical protein [Rhodococcus spongiicola]|uniref:Uncharacterized protein n=1 Tax=Rhodococcus spongiicola TaxID=2487352 RepID=A0A3S3AHT6_9NOCA|nr:hypothetical protein [Rhodococcus spongiicola]RVW00867.1 hypothetical protein EF834_15860 [Rhodococcus spongiicola]
MTTEPWLDPQPRAWVRATHRTSSGDTLACEVVEDTFALDGGGVISIDDRIDEQSEPLFTPLPDDTPDTWFPAKWLQMHQVSAHAQVTFLIEGPERRWINEQTCGTRLATTEPGADDG